MEMPFALKRAAEELLLGLKQKEIRRHAQTISERYRNGKDARRSLKGTKESAVYAVSRMPATFGAVAAAMEQVSALKGFQPKTLIDVGAGTGAAVWAASGFFDFDDILCLEREDAMLEAGQTLTQAGKDFFKTPPVWKKYDLTAAPLPQKADLITAAYVLNELPEQKRKQALSTLWEAAEQALVIVEPATPESFERMKKLRRLLIQNGAFIAAPCPHQNDCPNDWCHFGCRVTRSKLHRIAKGGKAPFEDEKFTYLVATRAKYASAPARLLRRPFIEKGKVTTTLCTPDGIREKSFSKKDEALYKAARKAGWGDALNPTE